MTPCREMIHKVLTGVVVAQSYQRSGRRFIVLGYQAPMIVGEVECRMLSGATLEDAVLDTIEPFMDGKRLDQIEEHARG